MCNANDSIPHWKKNSCLWLLHPGNCHECVLPTGIWEAMKTFQIILALGFPTEKMISNIFLHFTFTSCCLLYDEVLWQNLWWNMWLWFKEGQSSIIPVVGQVGTWSKNKKHLYKRKGLLKNFCKNVKLVWSLALFTRHVFQIDPLLFSDYTCCQLRLSTKLRHVQSTCCEKHLERTWLRNGCSDVKSLKSFAMM